jgi:hypothetical protein
MDFGPAGNPDPDDPKQHPAFAGFFISEPREAVMTTPAKKTQGSTLYVVNTLVSPIAVIPIPFIKGLSNIGGGKVKAIDKSNMDSGAYDELTGGRAAPPEMSGEIVLDKSNTGHQAAKALFEAANEGTIDTLQIFVGDSDSSAVPTLVTGTLTPPQTASPKHWARSGTLGNGYISNLMPKKADNDIDRMDIAIQWSGKASWVSKGDVIAKTY